MKSQNPCKDCIVKAMCKKSCDKYNSYVNIVIYELGYEIHPPFDIGTWIRAGLDEPRIFGIEACKISNENRYTISVVYDRNGSITHIYEKGKRYMI